MKKILVIVFVILAFLNYRHLNIGFLSIYSIDEYAFHGSLLNMYEGLISLDLHKLFSFGFYSYGFGFFFLNLMVTLPFFVSDNIEMTIFLPRLITSLFAIGSLWFIYQISRLYIDKYSSIFLSLILLSMPGFWSNALWFHPDWQMTFFILLSLYLFAKDNWEFRKYYWWGSLTLALALATKIQAITFYPMLFFYLYYENLKHKNFDHFYPKIILLIKSIGISIFVFILTNPYILHPIGFKSFLRNFITNMNSNATNHGVNIKVTLLDKISNTIDFYYLNTFLFFIVAFLSFVAVVPILKKQSKHSKQTIIPIIGLCFIINIAYNLLLINKDWQHYYLPSFILAPFLFIILIQELKKYKYILLSVILSIQFFSHLSEYKSVFTLGFYPEVETTIDEQKNVSNQLIKDLKFEIRNNTNILIEPYIPFDFRELGLKYKNIHIIYGPLSKNMFDLKAFLESSNLKDTLTFITKDFIVISKKSIYFNKERKQLMTDKEGYNDAIKIIENFNKSGDLGYKVFIDNEYYYIWINNKYSQIHSIN